MFQKYIFTQKTFQMINYDLNYQLEASKRIKLHSKYFLSIFKILKLLRHDFLENRFFF